MSDDQLDAQVAFFLEYEEHLRKWMALDYAARAAFDTFMHSLAPDLESLAGEIGDDVQVTDSGDERWGDYSVLGFFLPEWLPSPGELPVVAVGLVWHRKKATFRGFTGYHPCCAILGQKTFDGGALVTKLREKVKACNAELSGTAQGDARWIGWRAEHPSQDRFWEDLTPYRDQLTASVAQVWRSTGSVIVEAVREAGIGERGAEPGH